MAARMVDWKKVRGKAMGSPPLAPGRWPTGRRLATFCRRLEHAFKHCAGPGAPCREAALDRATAAGCSWSRRRTTRAYTGRMQS